MDYVYNSFRILPILSITSPSKRCGKSTLLSLLSKLCNRALLASNITSAATFRTIEKYQTTLLIDEADTFFKNSDELRGIINSGHTYETANVIRTVGNNYEPTVFSTWCPKAIACIGNLPPTVKDRSIEIALKRKKPTEVVQRFLVNDEYLDLQQKIVRWAQDIEDMLKIATPIYLVGLNDRATDSFQPLATIANILNSDIFQELRESALKLAGSDTEQDDELLIVLLEDLYQIFDISDKLPTAEILGKLKDMEDRPWSEFSKGSGLTAPKLARFLKPLKIKPKSIRVGPSTPKGYLRRDFEDAFSRYLNKSTSAKCVEDATSQQFNDINEFEINLDATRKISVADEESLNNAQNNNCCDVAETIPEDWLAKEIDSHLFGLNISVEDVKSNLSVDQKLRIKSGGMLDFELADICEKISERLSIQRE